MKYEVGEQFALRNDEDARYNFPFLCIESCYENVSYVVVSKSHSKQLLWNEVVGQAREKHLDEFYMSIYKPSDELIMLKIEIGQRYVSKDWQGDWESTERHMAERADYGLRTFYSSKFVAEILVLAKSKYDSSKFVVNRKMGDGTVFNNVPAGVEDFKGMIVDVPPQPQKSRLSRVIHDGD